MRSYKCSMRLRVPDQSGGSINYSVLNSCLASIVIVSKLPCVVIVLLFDNKTYHNLILIMEVMEQLSATNDIIHVFRSGTQERRDVITRV